MHTFDVTTPSFPPRPEASGSSLRGRFSLFAALLLTLPVSANPPNGKVILEAFWWDCLDRTYQTSPDGTGGWYTYLAKLCPRLRDMGIDGIWVPPACKGAEGTSGMGYSLFDHYDIGQKFQKNTTGTRFGNQDEYLRMIAVAHACGLEVYADVVLNHMNGGQSDPQAPGTKEKTFRYHGFTGADVGRWPKSWLDFHPNPHHAAGNDDWRVQLFGPDVCYHGRCCDTDCASAGTYMLDHARDWFVWFRKQTDVDGYRFDAVKHFPPEVVGDLLANAMPADPASYVAVGEFVVGKSEQAKIDDWAGATGNRSGTFDFAYREALYDLVTSAGYFDMGSLPNYQQQNRQKTVPFVNNHDTFRGAFADSSGNGKSDHGSGLKNGDELVPTIDPNSDWARVAYAACFAVDGSPQVYYEDLYDNSSTAARETADPRTLTTRSYVANLIWCHQMLNFKDGAYKVRYQGSPDLLVIERRGKAVIALNDNGIAAVPDTPLAIDTNFGPGVRLHDYSGTVADDQTTDAQGRALIKVPPKTYCVWAPAGIAGTFTGHPRRTIQEFQMSDDLGDSAPESLGYGGHLVATDFRKAGAVWVKNGSPIHVSIYTDQPRAVVTRVLQPGEHGAKSDVVASKAQGMATPAVPLIISAGALSEGYHQVVCKLAQTGDAPVRAYVKVEYEAPATSELF